MIVILFWQIFEKGLLYFILWSHNPLYVYGRLLKRKMFGGNMHTEDKMLIRIPVRKLFMFKIIYILLDN